MRIVAGKLRHRSIKMTNLDTTRETQDRVRESIFNMIGPYFDGGKALDLFAGSGAMAIEAYSRGITEIYLNDLHPLAIKTCRENCLNLQITTAHFSNLDYQKFLKNNKIPMDLIFLDPPYKMTNAQEILELVIPHLSQRGIVVFELGKDTEYPEYMGALKLIKNKLYGIKRVLIYDKGSECFEL
ncbi:MAG: 16S rRNA (guanine(966)-N(2))-methyltransferase RsmD [Anaeroplasmataceae bacterium]|nr:16S rRNA (guanine(966)-N(2))-methyltransferase RsmD [Anaeroplasmataceae bacterium]